MRVLFFDIGEIDYKGIEILSAVLKQKGHTVDLLLDPGLGKHYYLKLPVLNFLIGDSLLLKKAISFKPDIIGMSIVTNNFQYFRNFGLKLKKNLDVPVIVGGIHPTSVPDEVIKETWVDMLCVGDGEETMLELLEKLERKEDITQIRNLWVKDKSGAIHKNDLRPLKTDIDSYPFPDRSIYEQYGALSRRIRFMTGRGCTHHCTFCVNSFRNELYPGQTYLRKRSVENVIEELELIKKQYKAKGIRFEDDVFVLDKKWLSEFKDSYKSRINLPFHCYITPTGVKEDIIRELKEAGCYSIAMGIQSGNQEIRSSVMNRHYSNEKVIEAASIIKKAGIKLYAEYMFGFPGETPENMMETLLISDKIKANNTWAGIFYPYPLTKLTQSCLNTNLLIPQNYSKVINGIGSPHMSSLLQIPFADEAMRFKTILPIYSLSPMFFKLFLKKLLKRKYGSLHKAIYILGIPFLERREFFYRVIRIPSIVIRTTMVLKRKDKKNKESVL